MASSSKGMVKEKFLNLTGNFQWRILFTSLLICAGGSFHYGYQLTVLNPTEGLFRQFLNESSLHRYGKALTDIQYRVIWSFILNLQMIGAFIGTFPLVKLSENLGRRKTFYISSLVTLFGVLAQIFTKMTFSLELLALGRFVVGIGNGLALGLEPMFLNEISPVGRRGFYCSMTGIFVEMGFIVGGVVALPVIFGTVSLWPFMFIVELVPIVLLCSVLPFIPESPRFLVSRGRIEEAKRSCAFYGHANVDTSIQEMKGDIECQVEQVTFKEIWQKVHLRKATFLGSLVAMTSGFCGISAIDFFSTRILMDAGLSETASQYASVAIFVQCFISAILGGVLVDKVGRRILLLVSTGMFIVINTGLMVSNAVYITYGLAWVGYMSVALCILFAFNFGCGASVLQWTVASELVPQNARSSVQSIAMTLHKVAAIIAGVAFYPLQWSIGPYCFFLFIIPIIIYFIIFIFQFPETKNKTTVEILHSLGYTENSNGK